MKHLMTTVGGLLLAASFAASAVAQPAIAPAAAPLAYVQPVSPATVQAVQERLRSAGAYSGGVDGVWGPDSFAALQRFQASHQLQATGQLNQATITALGLDQSAILGTQQAAASPVMRPAENLRSSSVRAIQSHLRQLGFYSGAVDGSWGANTQSAIQKFQQGRGLQPDGQLNPATLSAMGMSPDALVYR